MTINDIRKEQGLPLYADSLRIRLPDGWVDCDEPLQLVDAADYYESLGVCPACFGRKVTSSGAFGRCAALCFQCKGTGKVP